VAASDRELEDWSFPGHLTRFRHELAEAGLAGFDALAWNGLFAPAGTSADIINRINADVNAAMADPAFRQNMAKQGLIVGGGSAAQFKAFIDSESRKWGAIITKAGIKLD
jgi:tripartite-type tricarboxylate transporter receptor subunit TctC